MLKVLQAVDPDTTVTLTLGEAKDWEYRERCAKAELISGECLMCLRIDVAQVIADADKPWVDLQLRQDNIMDGDLDGMATEFDKKYGID